MMDCQTGEIIERRLDRDQGKRARPSPAGSRLQGTRATLKESAWANLFGGAEEHLGIDGDEGRWCVNRRWIG